MPTRRRERRGARPRCPAAAALCALAIGLCSGSARAYPTSVVYAPSGEALAFGSFSLGGSVALGIAPQPVHFGSAWGSLDVGVVPSIELATTPAGKLAIGGAEVGFDLFGPDIDGRPTTVFNVKLQLLRQATYWPSISIGMFQISPDAKRGPSLGYFSLSKSFTFHDHELGQLTFGMMRSFAPDALIAPQCFVSGAQACLFRGSEPFLDGNGAFLAGYVSPYFGPVSFAIDHVGGSSAVSSTNVALNVRLWRDGAGTYVVAGIGGYLSNDRRGPLEGPSVEDGLFLQVSLGGNIFGLIGWDPMKASSGKKKGRDVNGRPEDPLDAPPLTPPTPTATPSSTTVPPAP